MCVCIILWNVVSLVVIVQETGVLKPYVLMHHVSAIFSWLRSGVTCAAGIVESFAVQFILSALKIPFLDNEVTYKARVEHKYIICWYVLFNRKKNNHSIPLLPSKMSNNLQILQKIDRHRHTLPVGHTIIDDLKG